MISNPKIVFQEVKHEKEDSGAAAGLSEFAAHLPSPPVLIMVGDADHPPDDGLPYGFGLHHDDHPSHIDSCDQETPLRSRLIRGHRTAQ